MSPYPGAFEKLFCPSGGAFASSFSKNANSRGSARGGGGGGWVLLELTDALVLYKKQCLVASGDLFISKCAVLRFPMQFIRTFCWLCVDARELIFALRSRIDRQQAVYFTARPACSIRVLFPPISGNFRFLLAESCVPYKVLLKLPFRACPRSSLSLFRSISGILACF